MEMLKIAVCDDEVYFREKLIEAITQYMNQNKIQYQIDEFSSGESFLSSGIEILQYTVLFLDINMNEIDGISVAQKVRELSDNLIIVFVTAFLDYTLEGYKVDAIRYLLKDMGNFQGVMDECLDAVMKRIHYDVTKITFHFNEGKKELFTKQILYIESRLHKLEFHIMDKMMKQYTMYTTLNELQEQLSEKDFIRIHQSYLVNIRYIENIEKGRVILINGVELSIAKSRYPYVKDVYIAYQGEM